MQVLSAVGEKSLCYDAGKTDTDHYACTVLERNKRTIILPLLGHG